MYILFFYKIYSTFIKILFYLFMEMIVKDIQVSKIWQKSLMNFNQKMTKITYKVYKDHKP